MNAKRAGLVFAALLVLCAILVGCSSSNVQTGTFVGWEGTFEGDETPSYMVELEDGTKIMALSEEPPPEVGAEVAVRKMDDGTWEIVPEE